ncbi:polyphosphate kinase 2 family protein [Methylorubrum salsuginis]|uniref:Polyphosphate:nucleotide phosphotransferase, PPK2 family n=1 Tax=Methylorubrum salsuginis TaxID=414703 RepID=A0A1I3YEY3_9HYPH|nr:polyphosphate kinase 2 family protein [Methylorubrum salsuginis]SFK30382.1 polyphosphate:nucleotide phosphotransferase, PPK2 family [Methylorubrum salsuginis]
MSKTNGKDADGPEPGKIRETASQGDAGHRTKGKETEKKAEKKAKRSAKKAAKQEARTRRLDDHPPSSAAWARAADAGMGTAPSLSPHRHPRLARAAPGIVTVEPGTRFALASVDADATGGLDKAEAKAALADERERIKALQEKLYAEHARSLLVVFQAIDTGGKDGTIRSVLEGVNPQGCRVWSFKVPSAEELDQDFLWRYHARAPGRGLIGVFNRSHYEDVLVVRVKGLVPEETWRERYGLINDFERLLTLSGTTILKFFLHISKDEQKERLEARLEDPDKHWKFDPADLTERKSWDAYRTAFDDALSRCSTPYAPWHVVPANRKWARNLMVARTIADTLEAMDPRFPPAREGLAGLKVPD